jgi:hypothetical protein
MFMREDTTNTSAATKENPRSPNSKPETSDVEKSVIPALKNNDEILDCILDRQEEPQPEAHFKITDRFVMASTDVGEYSIERSIFTVDLNYSGEKCLVVEIEDGLCSSADLYINFNTIKSLTGLSRVRGKDAIRFADRNYAALERMVADLNGAVIEEVTRTVAYSKSDDAYEGDNRYRRYIYERART